MCYYLCLKVVLANYSNALTHVVVVIYIQTAVIDKLEVSDSFFFLVSRSSPCHVQRIAQRKAYLCYLIWITSKQLTGRWLLQTITLKTNYLHSTLTVVSHKLLYLRISLSYKHTFTSDMATVCCMVGNTNVKFHLSLCWRVDKTEKKKFFGCLSMLVVLDGTSLRHSTDVGCWLKTVENSLYIVGNNISLIARGHQLNHP